MKTNNNNVGNNVMVVLKSQEEVYWLSKANQTIPWCSCMIFVQFAFQILDMITQ